MLCWIPFNGHPKPVGGEVWVALTVEGWRRAILGPFSSTAAACKLAERFASLKGLSDVQVLDLEAVRVQGLDKLPEFHISAALSPDS
jgi:hypothetical protein